MSLLDNLLGKAGLYREATKGIDNLSLAAGVGRQANPFILWQSKKSMSAGDALDQIHGWVYSCIRAISEEVARSNWKLFTVKSDGTSEELSTHPLLDLLNAVNQYQTGYELKYLTSTYLEACGNAYWLLDGVKKQGDIPTAIYPLNPKFIKIIKRPLPEFIGGYIYEVDGDKKILQPFEVLHIKTPNPADPYEGIGTIQNIAQWIDVENYQTEFNRRFFVNGARMGGLLESETAVNEGQIKLLRKSFEAIYSGIDNAYRMGILPKGVTFKEMGNTAKDMDFVEGQKNARDKILAGFRVPITVLGAAESNTNRATAETADFVFIARTVRPKLEMIVQYLNEFLVPLFGDNLYLDFENNIPEDRELKLREMQAATANQQVMSINEARDQYLGLPAIGAGGDEIMANYSLVSVGSTSSKKQIVRRAARKFDATFVKRKEIAENISEKAADALRKLNKEVTKAKKKDITKLSNEEFEPIYKKFNIRVSAFEKLINIAIQKFNAEQKKTVLANMTEATKAVDAGALFAYDEDVKLLVSMIEPIILDLYEKEAKEALSLIGDAAEFTLTSELKKAITNGVNLMSESYNTTTLGLLKSTLEQGLEDGLSFEELSKSIEQIYEFSDEARAMQVARTESFRAANDANKEAWKQSDVVKSVKWYTAVDEKVCPVCSPLDGKIVGIDENFFQKGDEVEGTDGKKITIDYADVGAPPLHVSCRCYIRPENIEI